MPIGVFALAPDMTWPDKPPDAYLDYSYDATRDLGADVLQSVRVCIAPSGPGELTAQVVSVSGALITVWLDGGVAGRGYIVKIIATCGSARQYAWAIGITVDPALARFPLADPPSTDFGPALSFP